MTPEVTVTVVIVTYNSAVALPTCLQSLSPARQGTAVEVVVVDNGSTDDTLAVAREHGDCLVIESSNRGYAAGINLGVRRSRGRGPVLALNPDTEVLPGALSVMAALAEDRHAVVAPRVIDDDGTTSASLRRAPTLRRALGLGFTQWPSLTEIVGSPSAYLHRGPVDWATGAAILVPRECHEALGGWDESFFMYSEETDFCLRAAAAGWPTLYEPTAVVRHSGQGSGWNHDLYAMQIINRVRLYRRRTGPLRGAAFFGLAVLREVVRAARGDRASRFAVIALALPSRRPPVLGTGSRLVPR